MITIQTISDPHSKIIALQNLADELAQRKDCKTAHLITLQQIRKAEMRLETANKGERYE
jgi:hypothetical protein